MGFVLAFEVDQAKLQLKSTKTDAEAGDLYKCIAILINQGLVLRLAEWGVCTVQLRSNMRVYMASMESIFLLLLPMYVDCRVTSFYSLSVQNPVDWI